MVSCVVTEQHMPLCGQDVWADRGLWPVTVKHASAQASPPHTHKSSTSAPWCVQLEAADEWEAELEGILHQFEAETGRGPTTYDVEYY